MAIEQAAKGGLPQVTLSDYEGPFRDRHLLHGVLSKWAAAKPDEPAILHHEAGTATSWKQLEETSTALAARLLRIGFRKGDFLAALLPFSLEHILLEYACFRIGLIHTPIDLRLRPAEVLRALRQVRARGFAFPGKTGAADFRELAEGVRRDCPTVEHLIQCGAPQDTVDGAICFAKLLQGPPASAQQLAQATQAVTESDAAQAIFTTGSTGSPKAALLSHRNITCQNLCLGAAFGFGPRTRLLVNLPPSHVGGQAEALLTTLFWGGTAVVTQAFDPGRSLEAIERHKVNVLGQIPAMYHYEWRHPGFDPQRLRSLQIAIYGGQQVARAFLERLAGMAPRIGSGLGLTEAAGFCTYTPPEASVDEIASSLGFDMPVYPMSVRAPMTSDGFAGPVLPDGEVGHVCFTGPQTFLGYADDPEATAASISKDGVLYTGDLGSQQADGLHFCGRAKWVIKPAGHQVFPGDVESHFSQMENVANCAVVGVPHPLLSEAIVAFVEPRGECTLAVEKLRIHARGIASYMRPLHYVILSPGAMPLNRAAKPDYLQLKQWAEREARTLGWMRDHE